jgi:hypothetical protein
MRQKNMVMSPAGRGTKNDCAGNGQQQFTQPTGQSGQQQSTVVVRLLLSSKRRPHFQTHKLSWNKQKFGHESQSNLKPKITVIAVADSKLLLCSGQSRESYDSVEVMTEKYGRKSHGAQNKE